MSAADDQYLDIQDTAGAAGWMVDWECITGVDTAVLVRRQERQPEAASDTETQNRVTQISDNRRLTWDDPFRPKSPMGVQTGLAGTAGQRATAEPARGRSFGDLPTVQAMGTGDMAPVIGFDTEFTYVDPEQTIRRIDSYQFSCMDPEDSRYRVDVVLLPLVDQRLGFEDCLAVVIRESGLWRRTLPDPRGIARRSFWVKKDFRASMDKLFKKRVVSFVLAGHYLPADLTAFAPPRPRRGGEKYEDILRRVTSASGGLVSLQPARMIAKSGEGSSGRWLPMSITVRDTMGQAAPGQKKLAALGEVCGVPKLDVGGAISDMTAMRRDRLVEFLEYGANDAVIVLEYLTALWGENAIPPVTLSGGGASALRAGIKSYWGLGSNAEFMAHFQGLMQVKDAESTDDDGLSYYAVRSLTPIDGDANQVHSAFKKAFHGGWNSCLAPGYFPVPTFDHDIQSAYPSAMAALVDVDFESGCIEEVIKDRSLTAHDFPLGPVTPLVTYASWEFPEGVEPCLPVRVGQSIVYPRTSAGAGAGQGEGLEDTSFSAFEGAWVCGPELALALRLGAEIRVQIGYRLRVLMFDDGPSRSMRSAVQQMVRDRAEAKRVWGKGSLVEQMIKVATNSCYGKLAQDVAEQRGWNSWAEEMENIGGSSVTSPYHAAMITSLVRALLLGMANEVRLLSVTTDGFITETVHVEGFDCHGNAPIFREARQALVGHPAVWEVKHRQDDLVNLTTRGNVSCTDGGVLAKAGLKTPRAIPRGSVDEREWFRRTAVSREGKIPNPYPSFPSFRELSRARDRVDFHPVVRTPSVSLDFDMKRRPLFESFRVDTVDGFEVVGFETAPWDSVTDYSRAREIARHIATVRPGTTGDDRPTGCLRTLTDWKTFQRRYESGVGRRVRTADSALLTELVAAHKEGLVVVSTLAAAVPVDQKLVWLSSLGMGDFSRAQWDHMSKRERRARVLADADLDTVQRLVDELPQW